MSPINQNGSHLIENDRKNLHKCKFFVIIIIVNTVLLVENQFFCNNDANHLLIRQLDEKKLAC
jgi:hypothetical protein